MFNNGVYPNPDFIDPPVTIRSSYGGDSFSSFLFSFPGERELMKWILCSLTHQCPHAQYHGTIESYLDSQRIVNVVVNHQQVISEEQQKRDTGSSID
jgi:hypothetical protein